MKKSISVLPKKRGRGRPATGKDPVLTLRAPPDLTQRIETWGAEQEPPLSRSEAIRALIERGLKSKKG